jgi:hypothetical protein
MEQNLIKSEIESRIFTIRGMQVMLDSDLAKLYNVETKALNQTVKRNLERFPESFRFQLSENEMQNLRSQIVTSSEIHGGRRYLPFVFTEQGVAMLSAVLKSSVAVAVSIEIIEAFVSMRRNQYQFLGLGQRVEGLESKQIQTERKLEKIFKALDSGHDIKQGIFFNDQIFDAYVFSSELISRAKKSIILIDNYIDETTLLQLSKRNEKVHCTIYTEKITAQLKLDLEKHNAQYSPIEIRILKNVHDRFLILDEEELYHLGASFKDLGKRWFAFSRLDGLVQEILSKLNV